MELTSFTIAELQKKLKNREISAMDLCEAYIESIERQDERIGAYITYNFDGARLIAQNVDAKCAQGEVLPSLAGIPCGIKDNISTRGILTTCGSKMLRDYVPPYDAYVMKKLYAQQVGLLGKHNMDEFGMGATTETSYFHITRNPRNIDYVPGGSSGGGAAAVASNQTAFALGSDTGGSIRQPAAFCGVVGMKPTYGTVSRNGLVAFASSLEQIGPMTKDVRDNAIVLSAIAGVDKGDQTTRGGTSQDYTRDIGKSVKGVKIAVVKEYMETVSCAVGESIREVIKMYERLGASVTEVSIGGLKTAVSAYNIISSGEAASNLARYDGVRYGHRSETFDSLEELYVNSRSEGFGLEVKRRIMLGSFALSAGHYESYYKRALHSKKRLVEEFDEVFQQFDCVLTPVTASTAYKIGEKGKSTLERYQEDFYTVAANLTGLPALAIPCGESEEGLPTGMQLMGRQNDEALLYRVAYAYESEKR